MKCNHSSEERMTASDGVCPVCLRLESATGGRLEGLKYALRMVQGRRILNRQPAYLAAVDEMEVFLLAAIERVERGEPMGGECIAH